MSSFNPYADCPCGSGKKVKFCCSDIADEIVRINRLIENHQMDQVRSALENLLKKPIKNASGRAWARTMLATLMPSGGAPRMKLIDEALQDVPTHPQATYVKAALLLQERGYPGAREALERAFVNASDQNRGSLARITDMLVHHFTIRRQWMAALRYLNLSLMLDATQQRMQALLEYLGSDAPMPTRSLIALDFPKGEPTPEQRAAIAATYQGAPFRGARLFEELAAKDPGDVAAWKNAGLSYAFCGEPEEAIRCLRKAIPLTTDFEAAADLETLAQTLERELLPRDKAVTCTWLIKGVSEVLSKLDALPTWVRMEADDLGATYLVLDREPPAQLTLDTAAHYVANVDVYDADGDEPASLIARISSRVDQKALIEQITRELSGAIDGEPQVTEGGVLAAEYEPLFLHHYVPETARLGDHRAIAKAACHKIVDQIWPNLKLTSLKGKTPLEAAGDPELRIPLAGAVNVLESFCLEQGYPFDRDAIRERVGLPATEFFDLPEGQAAQAYSVLEMSRLALASVNDDELSKLVEFSQMIGHHSLKERLAAELLSRPSLMQSLEASTVYRLMAQCCAERFSREESLAWINRARQEIQKGDIDPTTAYQMRFELDLEELRYRDDDPNDPQLQTLANRVWTAVQKLPEIRPQVVMLLKKLGVHGPWTLESAATASSPQADTGSGLWTPDAAQPAAASSGGLWVPE